MELCSNLYDAFLELSNLNNINYKYVSLSINRMHIVNMSMSAPCRNDILEMKKEVCLTMMEDKLIMMGVLGASLSQGSPLYGLVVELKFVDNTGKLIVIVCGLREFPHCCGSVTLSPFGVVGVMKEHDLNSWKVISSFIEITMAVARLCSYSNVVYILSKRDNEEFCEFIDQIKLRYSDTSSEFVNTKTDNICYVLTKNI